MIFRTAICACTSPARFDAWGEMLYKLWSFIGGESAQVRSRNCRFRDYLEDSALLSTSPPCRAVCRFLRNMHERLACPQEWTGFVLFGTCPNPKR